MTPEQISQITALGYFVVNHGQHVEDINKNIVVTKDAEGNCITDVPELNRLQIHIRHQKNLPLISVSVCLSCNPTKCL